MGVASLMAPPQARVATAADATRKKAYSVRVPLVAGGWTKKRRMRQKREMACPATVSTAATRSLADAQGTGWDSNPRYPCGYTGFRDRPFQPLTHLSELLDAQTPRCTDA